MSTERLKRCNFRRHAAKLKICLRESGRQMQTVGAVYKKVHICRIFVVILTRTFCLPPTRNMQHHYPGLSRGEGR